MGINIKAGDAKSDGDGDARGGDVSGVNLTDVQSTDEQSTGNTTDSKSTGTIVAGFVIVVLIIALGFGANAFDVKVPFLGIEGESVVEIEETEEAPPQ